MKISRLHGYASALALSTAFLAVPAFAQDEAASAEEEVSALDEIVVTASGRHQDGQRLCRARLHRVQQRDLSPV